ncbi:MAG: hypothetical protein ABI411_06695 [Tahibacter sp.]
MVLESTSRGTALFAFATASMVALAAGAVWALIALWAGRPLSTPAIAVAFLVGATLAPHLRLRTAWAAPMAAALTALACVYASCLIATAEVAMMMGLPLRSALGKIGPEMALAVAWSRASTLDLLIFAVATLVAAIVVWRRRR